MTGAGIDGAALGWRRKMQHDVGEAGDPLQAGEAIQIGENGAGAALAPDGHLRRVAQQGEDLIMTQQKGQCSARHVAAADD